MEPRHTSQGQTKQGASDGSQAWTAATICGGSGVPCGVEGIVGAHTALMMFRQGLLAQQAVLLIENPSTPKQRLTPECGVGQTGSDSISMST